MTVHNTINASSKGVLGVGIPNVYISGITLESTAGAMPSKDDPHIVHEGPEGLPSLEIAALTTEEIINVSDDRQLFVTLNMMMKEKIGPDSVLSWLLKDEIKKYLKIKIVLSTDPIVTKELTMRAKAYFSPGGILDNGASQADIIGGSSGKNYFANFNDTVKAVKIRNHVVIGQLTNNSLGGDMFDISIESISNIAQGFIFNKTPPDVDGNISGPPKTLKDLTSFVSEFDSEGNKIYSFPFDMRFNISKTEPEHLAVFAAPYLDLEEVAKQNGFEEIDIPNSIIELLSVGKITSEIIINNGSIVNAGAVFYENPELVDNITTENVAHTHKYLVDDNGNGIAYKACHPNYPNICHEHKITNWVVQGAKSTHIDPTYGIEWHQHNIVKASTTSATIWTGSVTKDPNGNWVKGVVYDPSKYLAYGPDGSTKLDEKLKQRDLLTRKMFPNTKIQDFRDVEEIEKLQIDYSSMAKDFNPKRFTSKLSPKPIEVAFTSEKGKGTKVIVINGNKKTIYQDIDYNRILGHEIKPEDIAGTSLSSFFSDMYIALSPHGVKKRKAFCRFAFSLDYKRLLQENSSFPMLYDILKSSDPGQLEVIMKEGKILNFVIKRRRVITKPSTVLESNRLGTPIRPIPYDKNEAPFIVVQTSEGAFTNFIAPGTNIGRAFGMSSLNQPIELMGSVKEEKFEIENGTGIRHFIGTDFQVSNQTAGSYQYSVEIEFIDPSVSYMSKKITELRTIVEGTPNSKIDGWKEYYQEATSDSTNYNSITNRFTKKYIESASHDAAHATLALFMAKIGSLTGADTDKLGEMGNKLWNISSPHTGNPKGILTVLKAMENIIDELQKLINSFSTNRRVKVSEVNNASLSFVSTQHMPNSSGTPPRTVKIEYYFPQTFDASNDGLTGYDYLSSKPLEISGFFGPKFVTANQMISRTKEETLKYFNSTEAEISILVLKADGSSPLNINVDPSLATNRYSYLSPNIVYVKDRDPFLTSAIEVNEQLSDLIVDIARYNQQKNNIGGGILMSQKSQILATQAGLISVEALAAVGTTAEKTRSDLVRYFADNGCTFRLFDPQAQTLATHTISPEFAPTNSGFQNIAAYNTSVSPIALNPIINIEDSVVNTNNFMLTLLGINNLNLGEFENQSRLYNMLDPVANPLRHYLLQYLKWKWEEAGQVHPIDSLPNQLKALIMLRTGENTDPIPETLENWAFDWLKHKKLVKIEKLSGYSLDDAGQVNLKSPIWHRMKSADAEEELDYKPGHMLCRLVEYENEKAGISKINTLDLPIFDNYFMTQKGHLPNAEPLVVSSLDTTMSAAMSIGGLAPQPEYISTNSIVSGDVSIGYTGNSATPTEGEVPAAPSAATGPGGAASMPGAGGEGIVY